MTQSPPVGMTQHQRRGKNMTKIKQRSGESKRLIEDAGRTHDWKRWGPYLSERQWGTVREDYSADGTCWDYFPHDHARSRAYRWGEDGLLGICDRRARLCFALVLWNGRDSILKERLFGLSGPEGNHGEDVKECYCYLDSTPTHSYMKALYKYPQAEFPYGRLVEENARRGKSDLEFELTDTGVFDDNRYWDVCAEYAKTSPDDILIRITISNRVPIGGRFICCRVCGFAIPGAGGVPVRSMNRSRSSHGATIRPCSPSITGWGSFALWRSRCPSNLVLNFCSPRTKPI